ncbi:MAG: flagellar biosynthesis anti-sigma factor FlgM [Firmicutes bacterium]|nr:flagellar biosynthesis anti-sigma factor FlgM [Bacillota bacterium]
MNPIEPNNTTGTPNPLARPPKTTTDPTAQVPGLSKATDTSTTANRKNGSTSQTDESVGVKKKAAQSDISQIATKQTRAQEVEQTRQLIAQGAYTIDLGKLADAMIKKQVIQ